MISGVGQLISKYSSKGILIDTNVLLLLLVGLFDEGLIEQFKRTNSYNPEDYHLVGKLISQFHHIVTTPHILAELTNLSPKWKGTRLAGYFATLVEIMKQTREEHICKDLILDSPLLPKIGFTDLSIMEAAKAKKCLILTDDFRAAGYLQKSGCDVINLNNLRGEMWFRT